MTITAQQQRRIDKVHESLRKYQSDLNDTYHALDSMQKLNQSLTNENQNLHSDHGPAFIDASLDYLEDHLHQIDGFRNMNTCD